MHLQSIYAPVQHETVKTCEHTKSTKGKRNVIEGIHEAMSILPEAVHS